MSSLASALDAWRFVEEETSWKQNTSPPEEDVPLEAVIEMTRELVSDNFENEEPTILRSAFNRAEKFLRAHSRETKKRCGYFPPVPSITPGPKGSADLHWLQPAWALLVNVPDGDALATFYGESEGGGRVKGNLDPKVWNLGIVTWLSKN